jgi:hypothetical protein
VRTVTVTVIVQVVTSVFGVVTTVQVTPPDG